MESGHTHAQFPYTRWTLVQRASKYDDRTRRRALEELCALYWPPVYAFVRSKGRTPTEAEDLTQGFFQQLIEREQFGAANQEKGKLRTFLLCSMSNYMCDDWKRRKCLKRGGGIEFLSITSEEEDRFCSELTDGMTPEQVFERHWVITLLDSVLSQLAETYKELGKGRTFMELKVFLTPSAEAPPRGEIAERLGITENRLNVAVHRLRQRYREKLRETIADTIHEDCSVEDELKYLFGTLQS